MNRNIAECVGLWLAEGDNKTNNEITFTNNCLDLVKHFHNTLYGLFKPNNIRVYTYGKSKNVIVPIKVLNVKNYIDKRARKPYFIWRFASVELNQEWKKIVNKYLYNQKNKTDILRGFFAGEGSVKYTSHSNRQLSISQKRRVEFIEELLDKLKVNYSFDLKHRRGYEIHGRNNWDKLAKIKIADLHPEKKEKFWRVYNSFKQYHYKRGYLKSQVCTLLNKKYYTSKQLSCALNRSQARITDVLIDLKKESKVTEFRVRSKNYWTTSKNLLLISKIKAKYLKFISNSELRTIDIAKKSKVRSRSVSNRLRELEKLGLIKRKEDKRWMKIPTNKKVEVI